MIDNRARLEEQLRRALFYGSLRSTLELDARRREAGPGPERLYRAGSPANNLIFFQGSLEHNGVRLVVKGNRNKSLCPAEKLHA